MESVRTGTIGLIIMSFLLVLLSCMAWFEKDLDAYKVGPKQIKVNKGLFLSALQATESLSIEGSINLKKGKYAIGKDSLLSKIKVRDNTSINLTIDTGVEVTQGQDGIAQILPVIRAFSVISTEPIGLHSSKLPDDIEVAFTGAKLVEENRESGDQKVAVGIDLGKTLASSFANWVLEALVHETPNERNIYDVFKAINASSISLAFNPDAEVEINGKLFVFGEGSVLKSTNVIIDRDAHSVDIAFEANIAIANGTRFSGMGAIIDGVSGKLLISGAYHNGRDGWHAEFGNPSSRSALELEGGQLHLNAGDRNASFDLDRLHIDVNRFECGKARHCKYDVLSEVHVNAGEMYLSGHKISFSSLRAESISAKKGSKSGSGRIGYILLKNPKVILAQKEEKSPTVSFNSLRIKDLYGEEFSSMSFASTDIEVGVGQLTMASPEGELRAGLHKGARFKVTHEEESKLTTVGMEASKSSLVAMAEHFALYKEGVASVEGKNLNIEANLTKDEMHFMALTPNPLNVVTDVEQQSLIKIDGVDFVFRKIEVAIKGGKTTLIADGLYFFLPKQPIMHAIRESLPTQIKGKEKPIGGIVETLVRAARPVDFGRLSSFRERADLSLSENVAIDYNDTVLNVTGQIRGTYIIIAKKKHIRTTMRKDRIRTKIPYPCVYHWKPKTCYKEGWTWGPPRPHIETSYSDIDALTFSVRVDTDILGGFNVDTPKPLKDITIKPFIDSCPNLDIHGLDDQLMAITSIDSLICDTLKTKVAKKTLHMSKLMKLEDSKILSNAKIHKLELRALGQEIVLGLDFLIKF